MISRHEQIKRKTLALYQTRKDLIEVAERYKNIQFDYLREKNGDHDYVYRKDSTDRSLIYCRHCIEAKNCVLENMPKLNVIRINYQLFCYCRQCKTIQCYDCFALVSIVNGKYLKQNCQTCMYRSRQEAKPTKKCECSEECTTMIPITNRYGKPQKYAYGHKIAVLSKAKRQATIDNLKKRVDESLYIYERK